MTNVINRTITVSTSNVAPAATPMVPPPQAASVVSSSSSSPPEYVAVLLASSIGTRLYPITTDGDDDDNIYTPKHMLPVCGIPILLRLLYSIELCGFVECVLLLKHDDMTTMDLFSSSTPSYQHPYQMVVPHPQQFPPPPNQSSNATTTTTKKPTSKETSTKTNESAEAPVKIMVVQSAQMKVTIVQYPTPCSGTVEAIRRVSTTNEANLLQYGAPPILRNPKSHLVVFPSDLIVLDTTPIRTMIHDHRCHDDDATNRYNCGSHHNSSLPRVEVYHDFTATKTNTQISHSQPPISPQGPEPALPQNLVNTAIPTTTSAIHMKNFDDGTFSYSPPVAGSVLLLDVTAVDESTSQPIFKESAKQKKGLLSRDDDDVFYMAIQTTKSNSNASSTHFRPIESNTTASTTNRLIWKQSKFDVEEDKEQIGTTPKVKLPKFRLYGGGGGTSTIPRLRRATDMMTTRISTEWNDVHCYCISSWVRQQLDNSPKLKSLRYQSLQYDLMPLLISRQYRGIGATFQSNASDKNKNSKPVPPSTAAHTSESVNQMQPSHPLERAPSTNHDNDEYVVLAHLSNSRTIASTTPSIFRSHTIASYLFANRILTHEICAMNVSSLQQLSSSGTTTTSTNALLQLPFGATIQSKFHTILLPETKIGEKVTFKSCVIGRHCSIGNNCRLNNVVLHDYVTIGDNTTLQSTIVSAHVTIGNNCNFNDCQILHHLNIPPITKKKGEAITSIDE